MRLCPRSVGERRDQNAVGKTSGKAGQHYYYIRSKQVEDEEIGRVLRSMEVIEVSRALSEDFDAVPANRKRHTGSRIM
jgi:hypothetical protein